MKFSLLLSEQPFETQFLSMNKWKDLSWGVRESRDEPELGQPTGRTEDVLSLPAKVSFLSSNERH